MTTYLSDVTEGRYELSPMQLTSTKGQAHEYPIIQKLNIRIDALRLYEEFLSCERTFSQSYLSERQHGLPYGLKEAKTVLNDFGFQADHYGAIGLMQIGTSSLLNEVLPYTCEVLQSFAPFCRAHYVKARPGLRIKPHVDCEDYTVHGFRIHIPLFNSAFYSFSRDRQTTDFELTPGSAWFVNNAVEHSARNPTTEIRVSILLQLMSDAKLLSLFV